MPHLLIGLAIFAGLASFIAFAFRQGQQVKPDADTKQGSHWVQGGDGHSGS
jgi:hypothetical protein